MTTQLLFKQGAAPLKIPVTLGQSVRLMYATQSVQGVSADEQVLCTLTTQNVSMQFGGSQVLFGGNVQAVAAPGIGCMTGDNAAVPLVVTIPLSDIRFTHDVEIKFSDGAGVPAGQITCCYELTSES